jgi:hypothetical protein
MAILSLQLLANATLSRAQVSEASRTVTEAAAAIAVLRRDLEAMVPGVGPERFSIGADGAAFGTSDGLSRVLVDWRLDPATGDLRRRAEDGAQVMLRDVADLRFRVAGARGGWLPGSSFTPDHPGDLPRGIEVIIDTARLGELRLVVTR